jgi:hypothetical protein
MRLAMFGRFLRGFWSKKKEKGEIVFSLVRDEGQRVYLVANLVEVGSVTRECWREAMHPNCRTIEQALLWRETGHIPEVPHEQNTEHS